jgi:hypothetical protein
MRDPAARRGFSGPDFADTRAATRLLIVLHFGVEDDLAVLFGIDDRDPSKS